MMQFYKKRDFGTFISDSFAFFKLHGKNYFKNFILLNGLLLILMVVLIILGFREFFGVLLGSNIGGQSYYFEQMLTDNLGLFILLGVLLFIISTALMTINFLFPVFYMKRVAEGHKDIKTDDLLSDFKANGKKVFLTYLGLTFLVMPAATILFGFSYFLIIIFIGIVLMLFVGPTLFNIILFLCYDYFNSERGFFESLSYAVRSQFSYTNGREGSPYWKYWGSTLIMGILFYIITAIFSSIPMILYFVTLTTTTSNAEFEKNPLGGSFGMLIFFLYGVSTLVSSFLMNVMYVNSGLMYYDSRTDLHQKVELEEIETIGINE
ncbi:hypothetical protein ATE47_14725 [Chryseobacterium sp. IHB B 17019]|uniref:DUF4013 domain-containing protein n=1 Tax=Chryseobacterium sp. IHB B 17019 TaxID=1721091 RepID=UPI000720D0D9|nr:DUF4013 domain-containing protein [Chryseobacterium sp. IHB B 17019]ALR31686.1 hypothetical protein ATE47_14725 [Chryseobacterium sp. IHB B 17019]